MQSGPANPIEPFMEPFMARSCTIQEASGCGSAALGQFRARADGVRVADPMQACSNRADVLQFGSRWEGWTVSGEARGSGRRTAKKWPSLGLGQSRGRAVWGTCPQALRFHIGEGRTSAETSRNKVCVCNDDWLHARIRMQIDLSLEADGCFVAARLFSIWNVCGVEARWVDSWSSTDTPVPAGEVA